MRPKRSQILPAMGSLWAAGGFLLILVPTVALLTYMDVGRQKAQSTRLLLEKGAALIRSFEAGTRTGMMGGMEPGVFRLQRLLMETAQQEDIDYLLVADDQGRVVAHSDPKRLGSRHGQAVDPAASEREAWRIVTDQRDRPVFEVYRKFMPGGNRSASGRDPAHAGRHAGGMHRGSMMMRRWLERNWPQGPPPSPDRLVIFVGLDMQAVEEARAANTRHAVVMAAIMSLAGAVGILLLVLLQSYRATRARLSRIRVFSDRLVENMPIGLVALGPAGEVAVVNPAGRGLLGRSVAAMTGHPARRVLPGALMDLADRLGPGQPSIEEEVDCAVHSGESLPLAVSAAVLSDDDGSDLGRILIFKDLSDVRALEAAVERSKRLAAVGSLAGGVAHEIRNPLSSLKGFATYFKERSTENPEAEQIAGIMIQEVDRLNRVVSQLLELSRPVKISPKALKLAAVIDTAVALVQPRAAAAGVEILLAVPDDLPPVPMDPERMHQVLLNLMLNAMDAMDDGGRLEVAVQAAGSHVEVRVSDSGRGILAADLSHVFDPYFTTKPTGTGLGLAIVHQIVEAHRGAVSIDSRPGSGTTVRLHLPLVREEDDHDDGP